jgi:hypothetical protein
LGLKKNKDQKRGIIWLGPVARVKFLLQPETYALELRLEINCTKMWKEEKKSIKWNVWCSNKKVIKWAQKNCSM